MAYVTNSVWSGDDRKHYITNIRICPHAWRFTTEHKKKENKFKAEMTLGLTMFHELMHITSSAGDKGYSKIECINLAKSNPAKARLNAQAYMYYAAEAGLTRTNYLRATGKAAISATCYDKSSHC
jgi:hypothetical protein